MSAAHELIDADRSVELLAEQLPQQPRNGVSAPQRFETPEAKSRGLVFIEHAVHTSANGRTGKVTKRSWRVTAPIADILIRPLPFSDRQDVREGVRVPPRGFAVLMKRQRPGHATGAAWAYLGDGRLTP